LLDLAWLGIEKWEMDGKWDMEDGKDYMYCCIMFQVSRTK